MVRFFLLATALVLAYAPGAPAVIWPLADGADVIGEITHDRIRDDDTLVSMARMHNIGHWEMRRANPDVDVWLPEPGTQVLVPQVHVLPDAPREGIVINLAEMRLYYFPETWPDTDSPVVSTHPVGVGLLDRATPTGTTRVAAKLDNPAWYPTENVRAWYAAEGKQLDAMVPPGPDNPLGEHALVLERSGYLIHGTHRPAGVGMRVSQGCVRLYPESIRTLIQRVEIGTPVNIIDQPAKAGFRDGRIFVEVHPAENGAEPGQLYGELTERVRSLEQAHAGRLLGPVDWDRVEQAFATADGVAVAVNGPADSRQMRVE